MRRPVSEAPAFLANGGEVGALMRNHDWSGSPLGAPESWPQALRTVVGLMLNSKFPMFVAWGAELGFLYNDSYAEIMGAKHPAAIGRRFEEIWEEIWDDILPIVRHAMEGNGSYYQNLPLTVNRNGYDEQAWFTFSYSPVRDETGGVVGMFCAVTETTEQVLTERHSAFEHERMRQLFLQAPGIIAIVREPNHVFEFANNAYLQHIGNRDIVGKPLREALPELEGQQFFALFDKVYKTGEPYVGHEVAVMLQREPGAPLEERFVNFVYQPTRDLQGRITGIFIEGSDVTDAVKANHALRESELRLRQLANTIPQLAWMADPDGQVHWYNDRWFEYTGATHETVGANGWEKYFETEDLSALQNKWLLSVASGQAFEVTARMRDGNGAFRTFYITAAPLHNTAGKIVQWFGTGTDVTPLEAARHELKEADRRKDEFLAMLAHELRNPLAPISAAADLLTFSGLDAEQIRRTSSVITRQVGHMTKLVDDLLDVSRVTRGIVTLQKEPLKIGQLVGEAVEQVHSLIEIKRQHLSISVPDNPVFVIGDHTRLVQVLSNILNNAAKYTPPEGRIDISVDADDAQVTIAVQDSGIGILPELMPHIFELFTQAERSPDRSQGGLGLGLALVKSLVELHGGRVTSYSEGLEKGSRFVVRLPRSMNEECSRKAGGALGGMAAASNRVSLMIVDDNKDAAHMLSLLLESTGHEVAVAYSAQDALESARRTSPSVLFLDIGLPDMDGYELARRLRAMPETAHSLLVAVTGYGQPEDQERALKAGIDHHLIKPVKFGAVLKILSSFD